MPYTKMMYALPDFPTADLFNWQRTGDFSLRERGNAESISDFFFHVTSDVSYVSL